MKKIVFLLFIGFSSYAANAQTPAKKNEIKKQVVEIACGECQFKMKGKSCDLAIRIDGKSYFVDGKNIDDFGDAHDEKHGFCNVTQKAEVTGIIVKNRFKATDIKLVDNK
jgi:hypothetical protein